MHGVIVSTSVRSGPANPSADDGAVFMVAGLAERGDTTRPILLRSIADLRDLLGDRTSWTTFDDHVVSHFQDGGARVIARRLVGPAAAKSTVPAPTATATVSVAFDAISEGAWGDRLTVTVAVGSTSGLRTISVAYDDEQLPGEVYRDLASPAAIVAALTKSLWVRARDLGSLLSAPANMPAAGSFDLAGGADDRASVTPTMVAAALAALPPELGAGVIAAPGYPAASIGAALKAAAVDSGRRLFLTSAAPGSTLAQAKTAAAALIGAGGEFGGLVWPSHIVPDGAGGTRVITGEGIAAAARARVHAAVGPEEQPIGEAGISRYSLGLDVDVDRATAELAEQDRLCYFRVVQNTVRLYNWAPLSADEENYPTLSVRDLLNVVQVQGEDALEEFYGKTIDPDGHLLSRAVGKLRGIADPIAARGGLTPLLDAAGDQVDPGYVVDAGASQNTPVTFATNSARILFGLRPSPVLNTLYLDLVKASPTARL